jgi:hypothetical protein
VQPADRPPARSSERGLFGHASRLATLLTPSAFAAAYVLISFANTPTPAGGLVRPLAVATLLPLTLTAMIATVTRRRALAVMIGTVASLLLTQVWLVLAVAGIALGWLLVVVVGRKLRGAAIPRPHLHGVAHVTGVFGALFAAISAVFAVPAAAASLGLQFDAPPGDPVAGDPDIVVLLLDGYPRSDVLLQAFGYDNSVFEADLRALGFTVSETSRSNYTATWATLASLFHGEYLDAIPDLDPFPSDPTQQYTALMRAIADGRELSELRERGYEVVTIPPPFGAAALLSADRTLDGGQMTSFELSLLQHSPLLSGIQLLAPDFVLDQQRDRVTSNLRSLSAVVDEARGRPAFLWTHLMVPHAPILWHADGSPASPPACFPGDCSLWAFARQSEWNQLPAQVEALNRVVIDAIGDVVAADPDAIVVVMSDHGHRAPDRPESDLLANFLAVRSPGTDADLFRDVTPVDLLEAIAAAAFETPFEAHPYRAWVSDAEAPLTLRSASGD